MNYTSGEMGPSTLNYNFETAKAEDFTVNGVQQVIVPAVNQSLIDHYVELCERHPKWTFGQIANGLHVDSATLRQIESATHTSLRSAKRS